MPPVLAAASILCKAKAQALEHGALLSMGVIFLLAATEVIPEVLVVFVVRRWLLSGHTSFLASGCTDAKRTGTCLGQARGTAVAHEAALAKELDEGMFTVARDGARIAHPSWCVRVRGIVGRWIACQAGEQSLTNGSKVAGAGVELLEAVRAMRAGWEGCIT